MASYKPTTIGIICILIGNASVAQQCTRPSQPDIGGDKFKALQKRASYASFLADECGFENEVQRKYGALLKIAGDDSPEIQQKGMEDFRAKKRQFSEGANFLSVKKRCILETGKTKAFVNEAADDVSSYMDSIAAMRRKYAEKMDDWNVCLARQKAAEEAAQAQAFAAAKATRAQTDAEAYKRSEEYARKKSVEDVEVSFRGSLMESGTYVLRLRNISNQTADFQLRCYQNNGNSKTFPIALSAGNTAEIGFLEGWHGNFVSGEYCQGLYKGDSLWKVTKK